jgi:hypothetical protein
MCIPCRGAFGLPDRWPQSRRQPVPCRRCGHGVLVRAIVRERGGANRESDALPPLSVRFRKQAGPTHGELPAPDLRAPLGVFETYVCRACGAAEWYVLWPEDIPIGPEYGTELVEVVLVR